jgi:hypothetical protein
VALGFTILFYKLLVLWLTGRAYSREADVHLRRIRRLVLLQVALDWMAMAVFPHLTGGLTSPAIPFFLIHMLIGAILFPGTHPLLTVGIGLGALVVLALLEATGLAPNLLALTLPARRPLPAVAFHPGTKWVLRDGGRTTSPFRPDTSQTCDETSNWCRRRAYIQSERTRIDGG